MSVQPDPALPALGTPFVTKTGGRMGAVIRWATGTEDQYSHWHDATVNHAGIYVGYTQLSGSDKPQLMQADPLKGFSFADWDTYPDAIWLTRMGQRQEDGSLIELTPALDDRIDICELAESIFHARYNFIDIAAIAFAQQRVNDYLGNRHKYSQLNVAYEDSWFIKRLSDNHKFICSQAVDYAWGKQHLFADNRPYGLVSPADLLSLKMGD